MSKRPLLSTKADADDTRLTIVDEIKTKIVMYARRTGTGIAEDDERCRFLNIKNDFNIKLVFFHVFFSSSFGSRQRRFHFYSKPGPTRIEFPKKIFHEWSSKSSRLSVSRHAPCTLNRKTVNRRQNTRVRLTTTIIFTSSIDLSYYICYV